ncbi:d-3-phosphoglycerate dehydrogenase [Lasius niger]|uniref:D-3-phosphoglycerate dehydrogenase n=1 Tax=Lasius niger TaxID=67767 RepID=A0A0J7MSX1_LASNI|nr:d-3-phosphoglycerate dehydrogenase [Lasius niger]
MCSHFYRRNQNEKVKSVVSLEKSTARMIFTRVAFILFLGLYSNILLVSCKDQNVTEVNVTEANVTELNEPDFATRKICVKMIFPSINWASALSFTQLLETETLKLH